MEDLTGQKINRWTILEKTFKKGNIQYYKCRCDCGTLRDVGGSYIRRGKSLSCGCYQIEISKAINTTHGKHGTLLYRRWGGIKNRCFNKKDKDYKNYGGRGIVMCNEWLNFETFEKWAIENGFKKELSIDRIDNEDGYNPNNCRWANSKTQANNNRNNHRVKINGKKYTITECAKIANISPTSILRRLKKGHKNEDLFKPTKYFLQKYSYNLTDSNGNKYKNIRNIGEFCKKHNINKNGLFYNFQINKNTYKNWKISRIINK
jgi:hypothetical protein